MAESLLTFLVSRNKKAVIHARRRIGHFGLKVAIQAHNMLLFGTGRGNAV